MPITPYRSIVPKVSTSVFVAGSAQIIGDVEIQEHTSVWFNAVIRGDVNSIRIGSFTNIQDLTLCHVSHQSKDQPNGAELNIGDYVTIGHSCILHGCQIGNHCLVGMGSIVMDHAIIQDHVMIGAGSLVAENKVLESGYLYLGRPAKKYRKLTDSEIKYLKYSAEHYAKVKDFYLQGNSIE